MNAEIPMADVEMPEMPEGGSCVQIFLQAARNKVLQLVLTQKH